MRKLKVLLYGDVDLNIMDGSAVWLTSLANVLNKDDNVYVDVVLKAPIRKKQLTDSILGLKQVNVIDTFQQFKDRTYENRNRMNVDEAVKLLEDLDKRNSYDCIIVRGINVVERIYNSDLRSKTIPYATEFTHDKNTISLRERSLLENFYSEFPYIFVQTQEMKEALAEIINVSGEKFQLILPMIPDYSSEPTFKNMNNSLVYAGKFAKDWFTEEILDAFEEIREKDKSITLNVAGDKFQGELVQNRKVIISKLTSQKGVNWVGAIPREEVQSLIRDSDVGIAWRSEDIDNNDSVELSTKLLEYGREGKAVILRRTKMHEKILGADYPLFADNEEDFKSKVIEILYDRKLYRKAAKTVFNACQKYTFNESYQALKPLLWSFFEGKTNIVFAGHDLKFLKNTIEYFENDINYEVKIDQWKGHSSHDIDQSKQLRDWADIVFCEWGLGNAVWYSNNKKPGQKLVVRMHLQERDTEHPGNFKIENIDRIIAISPYIYEEFSRVSNIPREKMTMIYNMIDTQKLNLPKENIKEVNYHLGICGILPSRKRIDKALAIFKKLWEKDKRYKLFVKSRLPKDLPWLQNRKDEMDYYDAVFERIQNAPWSNNIIFDKHGNDMDQWFKKIGYVLSTSDFESFHLAPMEGMASGSYPVVLKWPGSETIYPSKYLFSNEDDIVNFILNNKVSKTVIESNKEYPIKKFDIKVINNEIHNLIQEIL